MIYHFLGQDDDSHGQDKTQWGEGRSKAHARLVEPKHLLQQQATTPGNNNIFTKTLLNNFKGLLFWS